MGCWSCRFWAILYALIVGSFRSPRLQALTLLFFAVWAGVGIEHLLLRRGISKSNMNNRPEELTAYIEQHQRQRNGSPACAIVATDDSLLAYTVGDSAIPGTLLLDPEASPIPVPGKPLSLTSCSEVDLYRVQSYTGGLGEWGENMRRELISALSSPTTQTLQLSFDPEAARKRKLTFMSGTTDLPDYRYKVLVNRLTPADFVAIESKLADFKPRDGRTIREVNGTAKAHGQGF